MFLLIFRGCNFMVIIVEQAITVGQILGQQSLKKDVKYRPIKYLNTVFYDGGVIVNNLLTSEMVFLNCNEADMLNSQADYENPTFEALVNKWFLIPETQDELSLSKQLQTLTLAVNRIFTAPKIDSFTILTTTDCNARCFYCYEMGCNKKWMTEQTAEDVVSYILKNKCDGKIHLRWFGGEPLYNSKIIDYISTRLTELGVEFYSTMISNAYLFDEDMAKKAKELWKLIKVQITVDGTEEVYNKTKAYIYNDSESPFRRVINNIELVLQQGIFVNVRLNMGTHNVEDLFALTDFLLERFKKYKDFYVYSNILYDYRGEDITIENENERILLADKNLELLNHINSTKTKHFVYEKYKRSQTHCMADRDTSIMILPDGKLGKCEHFLDNKFIGSIYSDELDFNSINWFKETKVPLPECDFCNKRPFCIYLSNCPNIPKSCSDHERAMFDSIFEEYMIKSYEYIGEKENEAEI